MSNLVEPNEGEMHWLGALGVRVVYRAANGSLSIVEHPIKPRGLASPIHTHVNEDEYSYIVAGTAGFQLGDEVFTAGPGAFVAKPRDIPHAFWNAGDEPVRILELISPSGFENYFLEMAAAMPAEGPPGPEQFQLFTEIAAKYELDIDFGTAFTLMAEHGLNLGD
jgi:quercetin dioxygenase-like cupin family protein